jgi:hypothetical protein
LDRRTDAATEEGQPRCQSALPPKFIETPAVNGTPNFEAHTTLVDLVMQGGLLVVVCFVGILAAALFQASKTRLAGLTTLLCAVSVFGLTNLIVRQPLFRFAIALCLLSETVPWHRNKRPQTAIPE